MTNNILIYRSGGTLVLDEAFESRPVSATITIRPLDGGTSPAELLVSEQACDVDDLELSLPATPRAARVVSPYLTTGTLPNIAATGYRLLLTRGGRNVYLEPDEYEDDAGQCLSFRVEAGLPHDIKVEDKAYGLRVSADIDWSAATASTFTGSLMAIWKVTLANTKTVTINKVYDVVRQHIHNPATWTDVLKKRPDADADLTRTIDKEALVTSAWEDVTNTLYQMGIRHRLVIPDQSTTLRDAVVNQCIANLVLHMGLSVPISFGGDGEYYIEHLERLVQRSLGSFQMPIDMNNDGNISPTEVGVNRMACFPRSPRVRQGGGR